jgi:hypothetical protein
MKLQDFVLLAIIMVFVLIIWTIPINYEHKCIDNTHQICDGVCSCDSMECFSIPSGKAIQYVNAYDYQLDISTIPDSIIVMDGRRYVGTIPMWDNSPLDSLLLKDNE